MIALGKMPFIIAVVALAVSMPHKSWAQIAQDRPELCGAKFGTVPVPSTITARPTSSMSSTLVLGGPSRQTEILFKAHSIEQVCPISHDRVLAFGQAIPGVYHSALIDVGAAKLVDEFDTWFAPAMSPDHRWLIMQAFYPAQSDVPFSEEYLMYDLTKDRVQNTMPNVTVYTEEMRGRTVYPAVDRGIPFEHSGLPDNETHVSRSTWFYWASDSSAVLFADSIQDTLSIVLVRTDSESPRAFTHAIAPAEACEQGPDAKLSDAFLMLTDAEVGPGEHGDLVVVPHFRTRDEGACRLRQIVLHSYDFKPAQLEVHPPIIRSRPVVIRDPKEVKK